MINIPCQSYYTEYASVCIVIYTKGKLFLLSPSRDMMHGNWNKTLRHREIYVM